MENPATWGPAEKIIARTLDEFDENKRRSPDERIIGWSLPRQITYALQQSGLLLKENA